MTEAEKKAFVCNCKGTKGKDVIVITIETCCRKTCDGLTSDKLPTPTTADAEGLKTTSILSERGDAVTDVDTSDESDPSKWELKESDSKLKVAPQTDSVLRLHPDSEVHKPAQYKSKENHIREQHEQKPNLEIFHAKDAGKIEHDNKRVFKLPILPERHHGPGCALEISVLEKHENSCFYKKEDVEGRSSEDRVGSYECIGRLVFRTCNKNELESDSSRSSGINGEGTPAAIATYKSPVLSPSHGVPQHVSPQASQQIPKQLSLSPQASIKSYVSSPSTPPAAATIPSPPLPLPGVTEIDPESEGDDDFKSSKSVQEEIIHSESREPLQAFKKRRNSIDMHQVMMAATPNIPECPGCKRHFPGDNCRLHMPQSPFITPQLREKVYTSKKMFPSVADEGNQTDTKLINADTFIKRPEPSIETIASLSDLSRQMEQPKKTFFGSLFRKTSIKHSASGSRRFSSRER